MHVLSILFLAAWRDPGKFPASTAAAALAFLSLYLKVPTFGGLLLSPIGGSIGREKINIIFNLLCIIYRLRTGKQWQKEKEIK